MRNIFKKFGREGKNPGGWYPPLGRPKVDFYLGHLRVKLIQSYLSDRFQRVLLHGGSSDYLRILSGVPQGSILGPLLFLIFLEDIIKNIRNSMFLFADDTSLLSISDSWLEVETSVNSDLSIIADCLENG